MKLLFTGDINFRGINGLTYGESEKILSEVLPFAREADFVIPNLECPLGDGEKYNPIYKSGPNLICGEESICFLKAMNTYAVTLANNHIGDYGSEALKNTLSLLEKSGIRHIGAGNNIDEAYRALRLEKYGITVSVISVCENEFGIADERNGGSAGWSARRILAAIKSEKAVSRYVITAFHGGNEFNPLPSPDTAERYRLLCDMGADAVIGGHTHCPQGFEIYNGKPIVYSMGNFLFKSAAEKAENDSWYYGYMSALDIDGSGIRLCVIPYKFNKEATHITVFKSDQSEKMLSYISHLSDIIKRPEELRDYFLGWAFNHSWCPSLPSDLNNIPKDYNSAGNYNLIRCEAHLSQLTAVLETVFRGETEKARLMSEKIGELCKMPCE